MAHTQFEQLKKGCPTAFADIYAQYNKNIFWFGKQFVRDDFIIETLVQDTFLKLWINRDKIESPKHIYFFLRLVMKRGCISYYTMPKNKFFRKINALEDYENYQDYLAGYDPKDDAEDKKNLEIEQQRFDRIQNLVPLLQPESSHLIALCLKYDFEYKAIAKSMGISITETANKIKKAIHTIKTIIDRGGLLEAPQRPVQTINTQNTITKQQAAVLKLRCEENQSFAAIATVLNLSLKEVQGEFMTAYKFLKVKDQYHHQQKSA